MNTLHSPSGNTNPGEHLSGYWLVPVLIPVSWNAHAQSNYIRPDLNSSNGSSFALYDYVIFTEADDTDDTNTDDATVTK